MKQSSSAPVPLPVRPCMWPPPSRPASAGCGLCGSIFALWLPGSGWPGRQFEPAQQHLAPCPGKQTQIPKETASAATHVDAVLAVLTWSLGTFMRWSSWHHLYQESQGGHWGIHNCRRRPCGKKEWWHHCCNNRYFIQSSRGRTGYPDIWRTQLGPVVGLMPTALASKSVNKGTGVIAITVSSVTLRCGMALDDQIFSLPATAASQSSSMFRLLVKNALDTSCVSSLKDF